jgi:putative flippase GtrA
MITRFRARLGEYKELKRFIKFAIVGAIGFVVDFTTSNVAWTVLQNMSPPPSVMLPFTEISYVAIGGTLGFLAAIISNFIWNRFWTYPDSRSKSIGGQFVMFLAINVVGFLIRIPILENLTEPITAFIVSTVPGLGVEVLPFLGADIALRLGKNGALIVSVVIAMFWNFLVNRYLTYNDVD